ncbi:MAG: uroporphyrinogen decarboxylase family protein [Eubacteriales bacterium]|nr:uroporphyrinogen decarboxylase family protein [Eubacteriales bacterium]
MTHKERFIKALRREPLTGLVPHFELVFYLTMEAFQKVHPIHRRFDQWNQMSKDEQELQLYDMASVYIETARRYNHSAIFVHSDFGNYNFTASLLQKIRDISGDEYFIMLHGDPSFPIPDGNRMMEFSRQLFEEKEILHDKAKRDVENYRKSADRYKGSGLIDGFALCSDYCFNTNPFFSPELFDEFIMPYLSSIIKIYREMGYYSIKHTDGNIMPILSRLADCKPDALHSLDPQGGVSLKEVKSLYGDKLCLIGNVNCALLQTGTEEECINDIKRSLSQGMKGYGYIFSTSNCIYTGMALKRYELMLDIWRKFGVYK